MSQQSYYIIANESAINDCKFNTLKEAKGAIYAQYTEEERLKYFGDNHTPLIEHHKKNKGRF